MNKLVSPILEKNKISTNIKEIVKSNLLRLLNVENYEIYGIPQIGVGLKKLLFTTDITILEDYKNIITNYIQKELPYVEIEELNFIPFYYDEKGKQVIDFNNYDYVVYEIKYKIMDEIENFFEIVAKT